MIERRVAKAASEIARAPEFDHVVVNDRLEDAIRETTDILNRFIR